MQKLREVGTPEETLKESRELQAMNREMQDLEIDLSAQDERDLPTAINDCIAQIKQLHPSISDIDAKARCEKIIAVSRIGPRIEDSQDATKENCVSEVMSEIAGEDKSQEQKLAIAFSKCRDIYGEKAFNRVQDALKIIDVLEIIEREKL